MHPGPPHWLDETTLRQLRIASANAAANRDAATLRDMLWARFPALPVPAIEEAASLLLPARPHFLLARLARLATRIRPPTRTAQGTPPRHD